MDKWDFTKDQAKEAKIHADKVFDQTIKAFEYGKDQDVVDNLRSNRAETRQLAMDIYQKERDLVGDEAAKLNRDDRLKQYEFQVKRAGVSDEQWQASFDLKEDAIKIERTKQLLALVPKGMAASLSGDTKTNTKREAMSVDALTQYGSVFAARYDALSDKDKDSEFFKAAAGDTKTQATLMAFMEAQAGKNNNVKMEDLPKYFNYLGKTEGRGQAKAKEMLEAIMSGDEDVSDTDSFINGLVALSNVKEAKSLFVQVGAPEDLKEAKAKIDYWETSIVTDAYVALDSLPPKDRQEVQDALANVELKENKIKGLRTLAKYGYGKGAIAEHNMDVGYINNMYAGNTPTAAADAEIIPKEPAIIEDGLPEGLGGGEGVTSFSSWDEVEAARQEGFSGVANINGKEFEIAPVEDMDNSAPVIEELEDPYDAMEAELMEMSTKYDEPSRLRDANAVEKYMGEQVDGIGINTVTSDQVEGNRRGEKGIDLDTFTDRSFQGEGSTDEPMDLAGAPSKVITNKVVGLMDDVPARTPRKNIKPWMMKEFRERYVNADIDDAKLEAMIDELTQYVITDEE